MLSEERRQKMMELSEIAPILAALGTGAMALGKGAARIGTAGLKLGAGAIKSVGKSALGMAKKAGMSIGSTAKVAGKAALTGAGFSGVVGSDRPKPE